MRAALPFLARRPTLSNHVAVAVGKSCGCGQKEINNAYGAPGRKRHSHEHRNKDRNFPLGYTFHFSARIEPISPPHLNSKYFAAKRDSAARDQRTAGSRDQQAIGLTATELTQGQRRSHRQKQR